MSLGSWIFASVLTAVLIPTGAWAATATSSPVHLTSGNGGTNVGVTQNAQLLTVQIAPANVINVTGHSTSTCSQLYLPPAGKAVVVTSVTWASGALPSGQVQEYAELDGDANCQDDNSDFVQFPPNSPSVAHTFPVGLPMAAVYLYNLNGASVEATITGYLIPASQLPPQSATAGAAKGPLKK